MKRKKFLIGIILLGIVVIPVFYWQAGKYEETSRLLLWSLKLTKECVNGSAQSCKQATAINQTFEYYLSKLIYPLPDRIKASKGYQQWESLKIQAADNIYEANQAVELIQQRTTETDGSRETAPSTESTTGQPAGKN